MSEEPATAKPRRVATARTSRWPSGYAPGVSVARGPESDVVDQRVDEHEPPGLGRGDRDNQGVEQAVAVVADPVALECRHGCGQHGEREQPRRIGVRRRGGSDEGDRLAEGEQGGAGGEQPAGQPVLGCIAVGPDQHGAGDDDPDQGPGRGMQGVGGDQLVADGEEQHADE